MRGEGGKERSESIDELDHELRGERGVRAEGSREEENGGQHQDAKEIQLNTTNTERARREERNEAMEEAC